MLHRQVDADRDDALRLDDPNRRLALVLDDGAVELHGGARFVRDAGELRIALSAVDVADVEQSSLVVGIEQDRVAGRHVPAVDIAAERALAQQRGEDLALGRGRQRPAEGLQIPGQLVGILALAIPGLAARAGQMFDDLHPRLRALAAPARRLAIGADARENAREAVAPRVDGLEVDGEDVASFAAFDVDRADDGIVFRRPGRVQRVDMGIAHELMHLRVVAVVLDEARQCIVGFDLERLALLDVKHGLVSRIERVFRHFATLDDLH